MTSQENPKNPHCISLENRKNLVLSGVKEVDNYNETTVELYTEMGRLIIKGENLNIKKLNLELGDLELGGKISSLVYGGEKSKHGIFSRVFK